MLKQRRLLWPETISQWNGFIANSWEEVENMAFGTL